MNNDDAISLIFGFVLLVEWREIFSLKVFFKCSCYDFKIRVPAHASYNNWMMIIKRYTHQVHYTIVFSVENRNGTRFLLRLLKWIFISISLAYQLLVDVSFQRDHYYGKWLLYRRLLSIIMDTNAQRKFTFRVVSLLFHTVASAFFMWP